MRELYSSENRCTPHVVLYLGSLECKDSRLQLEEQAMKGNLFAKEMVKKIRKLEKIDKFVEL